MSSTRVSRFIRAPRERVFEAFVDGNAIARWMVPPAMTSVVHSFDGSPGGTFRVSLTYVSPSGAGKTTAHTDTYHGRFVELVRPERIVETVEFETDDPAFSGEMILRVTLREVDGGTELVAVHEGLPSGVNPKDNEVGWTQSLSKLASLLETP